MVNPTEMPVKPDHVSPAIERGLQVPKFHASQRRPLMLTEITQYTVHTANAHFRITDCLAKRG